MRTERGRHAPCVQDQTRPVEAGTVTFSMQRRLGTCDKSKTAWGRGCNGFRRMPAASRGSRLAKARQVLPLSARCSRRPCSTFRTSHKSKQHIDTLSRTSCECRVLQEQQYIFCLVILLPLLRFVSAAPASIAVVATIASAWSSAWQDNERFARQGDQTTNAAAA